ncbi:antibiotic biosynthesis monooxygenase [Psychrobacillus sp. FJAT-21963]|uniref:antibiotic biosynthesis monooxygenase family protein n=1 Tax=Psychrobacillus sp. FJAT-21963 TaxID=1712028 RepID=UPI0006F64E15|nr:antibiotic biosynthesis monooxygenase [Psychrobacillus sp. FJAT-21963]KQL33244.1 signal transduction protein TRAP [Psychrobacillus sp. FJAT-21963]
MNFYITSGTPEFMDSIKKKHPKEDLFLLHGVGNSVLIHETSGKSVFQVPRKYEILESYGRFSEKGYFVLQHIPLSDEGRPIFEYQYTKLTETVEKEPGFIALRVLKPLKSDTYIILTEWSGPNSFEVWKKSNPLNFDHVADKQKIFTSAPYVSTYKSLPKEA